MLSSFRVSWRNVTRHKKRFFLTLVAILLGVAVMTSMFISKSTFSHLMEQQEELYAGEADFWIQGNENHYSLTELNSIMAEDEIEEGILSLLKHGFVEIGTDSLPQASVRFTGVSSFDNNLITLPVKEGNVTKEGLIISENAANLWGKEVGDTVTFQDIGTMEITAIVYEGPMLNSPKTIENAILKDFRVMVPLESLQQWTGLDNQISNYRFKLKEGVNQEQFLSNYQKQLEGTNLFIQPVVVDSQQNNDVEGIYYIFDFIAILSIFISAFIVFNMIYTSIVERKREFATMKSLGYTARNVINLVMKEIGVLSVFGTIFGISLGVWLGIVVQDILISAISTQDVVYQVKILEPVILSVIVGLLFPFVAALFPLYKAGNLPIIEAMTDSKATIHRHGQFGKLRLILGILFTGIGLIDNIWAFLFLFVGLVLLFPIWMKLIQLILKPFITLLFGYSGKQAIRTMKQFENRNANTGAMLAIGVSLALFMIAALDSLPDGVEKEIRSTFGGDIHVQKETPWTDSDVEFIQNLKGVASVQDYKEIPNVTWNTMFGELREFSIMSYPSIEKASTFEVIQETEKNSDAPKLYLGERSLREWGGEIGDMIILHTPSGPVEFMVKGSVQTTHYTNYVGFVQEDVVKGELNWPWSKHVSIKVVDETMIPSVLQDIWERYNGEIEKTNSIINYIKGSTSAFDGTTELMQGLLLLIIAISAIGISNTLFMNTMERVNEIGVMRALGFTKSQVRIMIMAEGLLIGLVGVIVGTFYGILVIYLNSISVSAQGLLTFNVPWISLFIAISGGILFTIIASWLPSTSASKIPVKEAIHYE